MPEQRPPSAGCHRLTIALAELEDVAGMQVQITPVARACRLLHCPAYDPDAGSCNPADDRRCHHCPGSIFTVQPDVKKDEPT